MKKRKYRLFPIFTFIFSLIALVLTCPISASEGDGSATPMPDEYYSLVEGLPSEIADHLPEDFLSRDAEKVGTAIERISSAEYIFGFLSSLIGLGIRDAAFLLCSLVGIIVISSIFSAFRTTLRSEALSRAVGMASSAALFAPIIGFEIGHLERIGEYFERLSTLMLGVIPALGVLYAMGGNVTTAIVNNSSLYFMLGVCENFCAATVMPVTGVCTAFSICSSVSPAFNLRSLSSAVKKIYTFILGLMMTILLFSLGAQSTLTSAADTVSARAAKLVASNIIPIVGGSVAQTLGTLSSSVSYIKSVGGVSIIVFIIILVLPVTVTLLLTRLSLMLAVSVADILGCDSESKLLSEIGYIYGMLIAVVSISAVAFILALALFLRCTVAVG